MKLLSEISLGILVANGLRVTLGMPPMFWWGRSHACPTCDGKGFCLNEEV